MVTARSTLKSSRLEWSPVWQSFQKMLPLENFRERSLVPASKSHRHASRCSARLNLNQNCVLYPQVTSSSHRLVSWQQEDAIPSLEMPKARNLSALIVTTLFNRQLIGWMILKWQKPFSKKNHLVVDQTALVKAIYIHANLRKEDHLTVWQINNVMSHSYKIPTT